MTYDDVRSTIVNRIETERKAVIDKINTAIKVEDWEDIKADIEFIIQAHGAILMIDHVKEVGEKFDSETKPSA